MPKVINKTTPGKGWFLNWKLNLLSTSRNEVTTNTKFTCGEKVYKVEFTFFYSSNRWHSQLDFETTKGNDKLNKQV
jgi:hypothetical protein